MDYMNLALENFFKIIEDDKSIKGYKDYKTIRDLFSHKYYKLADASEKFSENSNLKNKFITKKFTGKDNKTVVVIDRYDHRNISSLINMSKKLKENVERHVLN